MEQFCKNALINEQIQVNATYEMLSRHNYGHLIIRGRIQLFAFLSYQDCANATNKALIHFALQSSKHLSLEPKSLIC